MKQIRKTDPKFMGFKAYAAHVFEENGSFSDATTAAKFLQHLNGELTSALSNPRFLYGHRTEAMFGAMIASLGFVKLLKQEDGTDCYAQDETLQIPDYRVILPSDENELIEAKNFHQGDPASDPFTMKPAYLQGLQNYSAMMHCPLKIAIYWSRWALWTLVPAEHFKSVDGKMSLDLGGAMMHNEMVRLGDVNVGTKMPLRITMKVDQLDAKDVPNEKEITPPFNDVEMSCDGQRLTEPEEQRIALYLMLYGNLEGSQSNSQDGDRLTKIVYEFGPREEQELETYRKQGFKIVGSLSTMFSHFYLSATSDEHGGPPKQIHARSSPGALGKLIPKGYKSDTLPLWVFHIGPNH